MSACLVCTRETACDRCAGKRSTYGGSWVGWVPCAVCGGSGLSHTHPRWLRNMARRAYIDSVRKRRKFRGRRRSRVYFRRITCGVLKGPCFEAYPRLWIQDEPLAGSHGLAGSTFNRIALWHPTNKARLVHLRDRMMRDALDVQDGVR